MRPFRAFAKRALPAAASVLALLQACALHPFGPEGAGDLREARERWERQGVRDYSYVVANTCYCGEDVIGPVRVVVRGGQTVSVTPVDPARPVRREAFEGLDTVEDLFATIRRAIDEDPDNLEARYDPELGYPVRVFVDHKRNWVDEESGFQVQDFQRIHVQ